MWYAIIGGAGLLVGLGLLVWALRERSLRSKAELAKVTLDAKVGQLAQANDVLQTQNNVLRIASTRTEVALRQLRELLTKTRRQLALCNDPKTVKQWLDTEMEDNEL